MNSKTKTVLLVEDQVVSAAPAIKVLKKAGYEVIYVMNGENAAVIIGSGVPVDIIVMDIDLGPGMCGITAYEKINSILDVPVLFFTSHTEQFIKERIGHILSYNYLSKERALISLVNSVDEIIHSLSLLKI